jgi:hypothetical protein
MVAMVELAKRCVYLALALSVFGNSVRAQSAATEDIVRGVVARSNAFFSGTIIYEQVQSREQVEGLSKDPSMEKASCELIFSGSSWRLKKQILVSEAAKDPKAAGYLKFDTASHRGLLVTHLLTPQPNGKVTSAGNLELEKPLSPPVLAAVPPTFTGSFWFETTKEFITNNAKKAARKPATTVNGVGAEVLEWVVPESEKYRAFHSVNNFIDKGGTLRLYVAVPLGYVVPRLEYLGQGGQVAFSLNSADFLEAAPGLFLAKHCQLQYPAPHSVLQIDYQIKRFENVNGPIADKDFVLTLPVGTAIQDLRPGKHASYVIGRSEMPADLEESLGLAPVREGLSRRIALAIGAILGALILIGLYLVRRRRQRKGS